MSGPEPEAPAPETAPAKPETAEPRPRRGGPALGFVIALIGLTWLLAATGALDVSPTAVIGLLLIAAGLAVLATPGAPHGLLITAGVVLALVGAVATAVNADLLQGGIGDRVETPLTAAAVKADYRLGIGQLTIDLTAASFAPGEPARVAGSVGIGKLVVLVPAAATVDVKGRAGIGNLQLLGRQEGGVDVDLRVQTEGEPSGPSLELDLEVGIGDLEVTGAG